MKRRHTVPAVLLAACMTIAASTGPGHAQAPASPQADAAHAELRALRDRVAAAIKARNADALFAEVADDVAFTAMDHAPAHGKAEARAYYERMMTGAASRVQDMNVTIEPDKLSALHDEGRTAIATGDSTAYFKLRAGLEFSAPLRWTATLVKQDTGWKIAAAHFSANMFENPIATNLRKYLYPMLAAAGVVGAIAGFVLALAFGRRRRSAA